MKVLSLAVLVVVLVLGGALQARAARPKLAVSACLLGHNTRYDGGNKLQPTLVRELQLHFELIPICPESFLGTPRPPIRLERRQGSVRLVQPATRRDLTVEMEQHNQTLLRSLAEQGVVGCVLKASSPTCGLQSTKLFENGQLVTPRHSGTFAEMASAGRQLLLADEVQLLQPGAVERLVQQVRDHQPGGLDHQTCTRSSGAR